MVFKIDLNKDDPLNTLLLCTTDICTRRLLIDLNNLFDFVSDENSRNMGPVTFNYILIVLFLLV